MTVSKEMQRTAVQQMVSRWRLDLERLKRLCGEPSTADKPDEYAELYSHLGDAIISGDAWLAAPENHPKRRKIA